MFLFDADKAANGGIFRELWAIVRNFAMTSGLRLAAAIIVLLLGLKIAKTVLKRYEKSRAFQKIVPDVRGVVRWLAGFLLYALIIVLVIGILGIPLASVATIISSAAIAVGLALQGSLANFAGGVMILLFRPFLVGDFIELKSGESGTVTSISIFYTTLHTIDNHKLVIPNGTVSNASVSNYSAMQERRLSLDFSVRPDTDAARMSGLLRGIAASHDKVLQDPPPFARLTKLTETAAVYTLRVWCRNADYWDVNYDLLEHAGRALIENGISFPAARMDVRVCGNDASCRNTEPTGTNV